MVRKYKGLFLMLSLVLVLAMATGCGLFGGDEEGTDTVVDAGETQDTIGDPAGSRGSVTDRDATRVPEDLMSTIYFDYDRSRIRPDQGSSLEENADYLVEHKDVRILIEGHCDERGTLEYNMALGQRRANAVRDFFVSRGVDSDRLRTVSRGEELPAVEGSNEEAWLWNRRVEFHYIW